MRKELPPPQIKRRSIHENREQEALQAGINPLVARIIAARPFLEKRSPHDQLYPKLKMLDNPGSLADMEKAIARLLMALENQEIIGIETDHDCDGQTSHAVLYTALTEHFGHPPSHIRSYIGHRLKEGYGLSASVAARIIHDEPKPHLIITADNGSQDEAQIALLKAANIDVIVTDHHEIPNEGIPQSAVAVINPTREDCPYPDRYIAGCMVAWLFMAATRQALAQKTGKEIRSLVDCLDYVAVGTIADCVSIARSINNRAVVSYGMKLIEQGSRPCWRALQPVLSLPLSSEDLGYKIGPLLNSDGRLSSAFGSVSFLLAPDEEEAKRWVSHLQAQNLSRKEVQEKITKLALTQALIQYQQGKSSLCLFLEDGHAGVHGISASRVKDAFGRPVVILCPKAEDPELLTGSARSIEGVHIRNIFQTVSDRYPEIMVRFGGHQGAAGLTLMRKNLPRFAEALEEVLQEQVVSELLGPVIWTDGLLPIEHVNLDFISELNNLLEPFGREFEPPTFETQGKVLSISLMGQTKVHARLGLMIDEVWLEAVWFHCKESQEQPMPVAIGEEVKLVFSPKLQTFRGERQLSCQIIHLEPVRSTARADLQVLVY